jgi:hypothetical protein
MHTFLYVNKTGEISFHSLFKKAFLFSCYKNIDFTYIISYIDNLNGGIRRAIEVESSLARRSVQEAIFQRNSELDKFLNQAALYFELQSLYFWTTPHGFSRFQKGIFQHHREVFFYFLADFLIVCFPLTLRSGIPWVSPLVWSPEKVFLNF